MEKKNYKNYPIEHIGGSDAARLIIDSPNKVDYIRFMEDGDYMAYIVDENAEIGNHYNKVFECTTWARIYDDEELKKTYHGDKITVYRAGDFGCVIQITNRRD